MCGLGHDSARVVVSVSQAMRCCTSSPPETWPQCGKPAEPSSPPSPTTLPLTAIMPPGCVGAGRRTRDALPASLSWAENPCRPRAPRRRTRHSRPPPQGSFTTASRSFLRVTWDHAAVLDRGLVKVVLHHGGAAERGARGAPRSSTSHLQALSCGHVRVLP